MEKKQIKILYIEDNQGDVDLTIEALAEAKILNKIYTVENGILALDFLNKRGDFKDAKRPDIMFLDLNMPKMDGREFLEIVKKDENLKSIPVVVLTTSSAETDIIKSYNLHANCYITKPVDFEKFIQIVKSIESFWLNIVKLPNQ